MGLSEDGIAFDDVRYREPVRRRRPDRDRAWACLAYEVPGVDDLPIFLDHATAEAVERHALRDTGVELGGILLGKECLDDQTGAPFVVVSRSLEARHYENTQASFTYTHDSWQEITRERDRLHPELDVVGWYHTHPDFGVFLSGHDLFIQRHFFGQPLQLAYVVDPVRQTRGFFQWRGGSMSEAGGFYLTAPRGDRLRLARLANDLENVRDAGGDSIPGGGFLSPRIEAELIAMLSRTPARSQSQDLADAMSRGPTALLFTALGATLGAVGLGILLGLNALNGQLQAQSRVIRDLDQTLRESVDRQRVALDAAAESSGGPTFLDRYARAVRDRDEAKSRLANRDAVSDALAARNTQLAADLLDANGRLEEAKRLEAEAREAADLRTRLAKLQDSHDRQAERLRGLEGVLDTPEGRQALSLATKYRTAWFAAAAGWLASAALLALVFLTYHGRRPPPLPDRYESPEASPE